MRVVVEFIFSLSLSHTLPPSCSVLVSAHTHTCVFHFILLSFRSFSLLFLDFYSSVRVRVVERESARARDWHRPINQMLLIIIMASENRMHQRTKAAQNTAMPERSRLHPHPHSPPSHLSSPLPSSSRPTPSQPLPCPSLLSERCLEAQ